MIGVEKLLDTSQCMGLEGRRIDAAGTARLSAALSSERFFGDPDTTLTPVC